MRAIEFRFYDLTNEKMVYLGDEYFSLCAFLCAYETKKTSTSDLMKYTGLKDAKGNKIFEGDVLDVCFGVNDNLVGTVEQNEYGTWMVKGEGVCKVYDVIFQSTVIGNKYQKELNEQKTANIGTDRDG